MPRPIKVERSRKWGRSWRHWRRGRTFNRRWI